MANGSLATAFIHVDPGDQNNVEASVKTGMVGLKREYPHWFSDGLRRLGGDWLA